MGQSFASFESILETTTPLRPQKCSKCSSRIMVIYGDCVTTFQEQSPTFCNFRVDLC